MHGVPKRHVGVHLQLWRNSVKLAFVTHCLISLVAVSVSAYETRHGSSKLCRERTL